MKIKLLMATFFFIPALVMAEGAPKIETPVVAGTPKTNDDIIKPAAPVPVKALSTIAKPAAPVAVKAVPTIVIPTVPEVREKGASGVGGINQEARGEHGMPWGVELTPAERETLKKAEALPENGTPSAAEILVMSKQGRGWGYNGLWWGWSSPPME